MLQSPTKRCQEWKIRPSSHLDLVTFLRIDCILHICKDCRTDKLKTQLVNSNASKLQDNRKCFLVKQWVTKTRKFEGATQSYLHWNIDWLSYSGLIDLYISHLDYMAEHTFMASRNYCQFKKAKRNIIPGELMLIHKFSQNYLCLLQNESQGMHWNHEQVTLPYGWFICLADCCRMNLSSPSLLHLI